MTLPSPRDLGRRLPAGAVRDYARIALVYTRGRALRSELEQMEVVAAGLRQVEGVPTPWIELADGVALAGRPPIGAERQLYRRWRSSLPDLLSEEHIQVAIDIVHRYRYPHAMPGLCPPYPRTERGAFHPQHRQTIQDLETSDSLRTELLDRFAPKSGDRLLDVGAYMGFGAVRFARETGADGRVLAVEADPDTLRLLRHNIEINGLENRIAVVARAIWNRSGESMSFHTGGRQRNSIVANIVDTDRSVEVKTTTVDDVLSDHSYGTIDAISLTVNGAEVEAVDGMGQTLGQTWPLRLSMAGWYERDEGPICDLVVPLVSQAGLSVAVTDGGGVFAWR